MCNNDMSDRKNEKTPLVQNILILISCIIRNAIITVKLLTKHHMQTYNLLIIISQQLSANTNSMLETKIIALVIKVGVSNT